MSTTLRFAHRAPALLVSLACLLAAASQATSQTVPTRFAGHDHTALGAANLEVDSASGWLQLSGIGSSGQDGYTIVLGDSDGASIRFGDGVRGSRPPSGGQHNVLARYPSQGSIARVGAMNDNGSLQMEIDLSPTGANSATGRCYLSGDLVGEIDTGAVVTLDVDSWPDEIGIDIVAGEAVCFASWIDPATIAPVGGGPASYTRIEWSSETGGALNGLSVGELLWTAANIPAAEIRGETMRLGDARYEGLGNAIFTLPSGEEFGLAEIGASGLDGFIAAPVFAPFLPEGVPLRAKVGLESSTPVEVANPLSGTREEARSYGEISSGLVERVGGGAIWTDYNVGDPGITLVGLYEELGATVYTLQAFVDGVMVLEQSGLPQAMAKLAEFAVQYRETELDFLTQSAQTSFDFGRPIQLTLPGATKQAVLADRVRIIPEDLKLFPNSLHGIGVSMAKVPDVTLKRGVLALPAPAASLLGMSMQPLGAATLESLAGGELRVSNIGSSGLDGVTIDTADEDGDPVLDILLSTQWPLAVGPAEIRFTTRPETATIAGVGGVAIGFDGAQWSMSVDPLSLGSPDYDLILAGDEVELLNVPAHQGQIRFPQLPEYVGIDETLDGDLILFVGWDSPQLVEVEGQGTEASRRISSVLRHRDRAVSLGDFELLALGLPAVQVGRASVAPLHRWMHLIGAAQLRFKDTLPGEVRLTNLGNDGADGVVLGGGDDDTTTDPGGAGSGGRVLARPAPDPNGSFGPNATMLLSPLGVLVAGDPGPDQALGLITLQRDPAAGTQGLLVDFQVLGSVFVQVSWEDASGQTGQLTLPAGLVATLQSWPDEISTDLDAAVVPQLSLGFDVPAPITLPNLEKRQTQVLVRRLSVEPIGAASLPAVHSLRITTQDIVELGLLVQAGPVAVEDDGPGRPVRSLHGSVLDAPYPNPFNPRATISFALSTPGRARLEIYDLAGRRVRTLMDEVLPAGEGQTVWDGTDTGGRRVASGIYLVRLAAPDGIRGRKLVLVE